MSEERSSEVTVTERLTTCGDLGSKDFVFTELTYSSITLSVCNPSGVVTSDGVVYSRRFCRTRTYYSR